jgi:FkbM family methyltransferase
LTLPSTAHDNNVGCGCGWGLFGGSQERARARRLLRLTGMAPHSASPPARLLESTHMAIKKCRHGTMMYNVNDAFIGRSLDLYGEWCDDEVFVLGQILSPGNVVIDVGANIGTHTVFFAKRVTPNGIVIAFEPQRLVYQTLCGNIALNGLTNVSSFLAAVGETRDKLVFPSIDPRVTFNFGAVRGEAQGPGETVDVIPIDELGLPRCALIKIDVEGMEAKVIAGAKETILRCRPALFLENDTVERSREVLEAVESIGYKAFWQISNYYNPKNFFGNREDVFGRFQPQANVLCVPKECPFNGLMPVDGLDDNWKKAALRLMQASVRAPTR